jgi:hypothetical protein
MSDRYQVFDNQLPERLQGELDLALSLGVKPLKIGVKGLTVEGLNIKIYLQINT